MWIIVGMVVLLAAAVAGTLAAHEIERRRFRNEVKRRERARRFAGRQ